MKSLLIASFVGLMPVAFAAQSAPTARPQPIAQRGFFYVGGHYAGANASEVMTGQM